jgi:hypothetical protein
VGDAAADGNHTLSSYLTRIYRSIYHCPYWIVPLVLEELQSQDSRHFKPTPGYVQSLCGAAITMQRAWQAVGFAHTYWPEELNLAPRSARTLRYRRSGRVLLERDDD